jgi:biopolymer transport protein ExbD
MSAAKKRGFVKPASAPNSDINVTPLVDVVLVLLIIFMVVTPLMEKDIEVRLPDTEQTEEIPPEDTPQGQLVVTVNPQGVIAINNEPISEEDYVPRLKRMIAAKPSGEKLVFFMPDETANYGRVIAAVDGAKAAGAETLGMVTELPPAPAAGGEAGAPPAPPAPPTP